ncbi:MAG: HD domain-containing protein [Bacillota bacterium]|nr:HD domain-containing protein [Bacillota bacterium]
MEQKGPLIIKEANNVGQGQQFHGKYLILDKVHRRTKDGKEIDNLKLGDASGELDAIVWENCPVAGTLEVGAVIALLGDMGNFGGRLQVTAKKIKVLDEPPYPYMRQPDIPIEELIKSFDEMMESITDPYLQLLMENFFTPAFREKFFQSTAAKRVHHNYVGGLLEHTVSVARLCLKVAESFPGLNRDLLLCGALLHDTGKVAEYEIKVAPRYTVEGRLMGHIVMGSEWVGQQIHQVREQGLDFPQKLEWMLKHMILSHHGSLEYGSPVIPLFPEAFVLHEMDHMDAKLHVFFSKMEETQGDEDLFTNYDAFFGQQFFTYRYQAEESE